MAVYAEDENRSNDKILFERKFPIEFCVVLPMFHYTVSLSGFDRLNGVCRLTKGN